MRKHADEHDDRARRGVAGGATGVGEQVARAVTQPIAGLGSAIKESERVLLVRDQEVDHFKILRLLGRGGMGDVYLARDKKLGRKVALKIVHRSAMGRADDAVDRFLLEARTTAIFNHPNIVTVYAVGEFEGLAYLALEYLRGQTLRDRMSEGRFSPREVARIGLAIAEALKEAHRHHVLHRDLKPENVLVPPDGRLRVVDFGLARQMDDAPPLSERTTRSVSTDSEWDSAAMGHLSRDDNFRGTPLYMAPEQWAGRTLDEATDLWALGLILYELLDGRHPLAGLSFDAVATLVNNPEPNLLMGHSGALPRQLVNIISSCLAKNPTDRLAASEVVEQLNVFLRVEGPRMAEDECPFRGLMPFTEGHANNFFGRDADIARFVEQLRHRALLLVIGTSGAGKSSLIRAGVIPRLGDSDRWLLLRMQPGSRPFEALAQQLLATPEYLAGPDSTDIMLDEHSVDDGDVMTLAAKLEEEPGQLGLVLRSLAERHSAKVLLFVDQLEEIITLVGEHDLRTRFMLALCRAADQVHDPVRVVLAARDEFVGRLATNDEAREALGGMFYVSPPNQAAIESTLRQPVAAAGYHYDDTKLPSEMVAAVHGESACLPLLQFAAQQLWESRDRDKCLLRREAYESMGGVEGALAKHANGVLDALSTSETRTARQLLLRLVTPTRDRRTVVRCTLIDGLGGEAAPVLDRLTEARLLTIRKQHGNEDPEATVELAHGSLISRWDTLRRWLDEGQEELVFLAEATQASELWQKRGQRDDELWRGVALRDALRVLAKSSQTVPGRVRQFVQAAHQIQTQRARFRRLLLAAVMTALSFVAVVLTWQTNQADEQREQAQHERAKAERNEAAVLVEGARAAALLGDILEARAKLRLALEHDDTTSARALWGQLKSRPAVWRRKFGAVLYAVALSPDGTRAAAASSDKSVYLIDTKTRAVRTLRGHDDQVLAVAFHSDGLTLASGDYAGKVRLWDLRTGRTTRILSGHQGGIHDLNFGPKGQLIASASNDTTVRIWQLRTGKVQQVLSGHTGGVLSVRFRSDGNQIVTGSRDTTLRAWDAHTGKTIRIFSGHTNVVRSVSMNSDDGLIASGSDDKTIRIWDARTGSTKHTLYGHAKGVQSVNFGPQGQRLASGSDDKTIRLWDVRTGAHERTLSDHSETVLSVSFGSKGKLLVSGGFDQTVRLWNMHTPSDAPPLSGHTSLATGVSFSPDGRLLASSGDDKKLRLWDARTGDVERILTGHTAEVLGVSFSPNGRLLASGGLDRMVRLWNVRTGREEHAFPGHTRAIRSVSFSPDGRLLASSSYDKTIRLWDVDKRQVLRTLRGHTLGVRETTFSPDGRLLASSSFDKTIRIRDLASGKTKHILSGHTSGVFGVRFGPQGESLASASGDKTVRIWDAQTGREKLVLAQPARSFFLDFHPGGRLVGVPGWDGVARIWDIEHKKIVTELHGHSGPINVLRFSPDGKWAATASDDDTVRLWDVTSGAPIWRAPLLLASPPRLLSHRGWTALDDSVPTEPKGKEADKAHRANSQDGENWRAAVEQRARSAAVAPDGKLLCLQSFDGALELWMLDRDELVRQEKLAGLRELRAVSGGCLLRSASEDGGHALLVTHEGDIQTLPTDGKVTAIGTSGRTLLVATGKQILEFDASGALTHRYSASAGISAMTRVDATRLAVGYVSGAIELVSTGITKEADPLATKPIYSFEKTASNRVTRILAGPLDTVIVGYANGLVGMWSLADGRRLAHGRVHGPIEHLLLEKQNLYVATSLGQHLVWDLSALYIERCALLHEVWEQVPIVWQDNHAVVKRPQPKHPCQTPEPPS